MTIDCKTTNCQVCKGELKYYDTVIRTILSKGGLKHKHKIKRFKCVSCNKIYRQLPNYILKNKHYEREIINNVITGKINQDTLGFENYPSNITMKRWIREKNK